MYIHISNYFMASRAFVYGLLKSSTNNDGYVYTLKTERHAFFMKKLLEWTWILVITYGTSLKGFRILCILKWQGGGVILPP